MEKAPALDPMPLYGPCMVAFYRGAPAPVVPTPLTLLMEASIFHLEGRGSSEHPSVYFILSGGFDSGGGGP